MSCTDSPPVVVPFPCSIPSLPRPPELSPIFHLPRRKVRDVSRLLYHFSLQLGRDYDIEGHSTTYCDYLSILTFQTNVRYLHSISTPLAPRVGPFLSAPVGISAALRPILSVKRRRNGRKQPAAPLLPSYRNALSFPEIGELYLVLMLCGQISSLSLCHFAQTISRRLGRRAKIVNARLY